MSLLKAFCNLMHEKRLFVRELQPLHFFPVFMVIFN
jgi:hypothetical protein